MGRGRAPCCDKSQVKRGPWSPSEDLKLISFIRLYGHDNWRALPKLAGLSRCGKSCRLRWINYLRPDVRRGNFTKEEEETIIRLHQSLGNKWSKIASHLPGRTDNEIKNVWNTHLKKKLPALANRDEPKRESSLASSSSSSSSPSSSSFAASKDGDGDAMEMDPGNKELPEDFPGRTGPWSRSLSSLSHGSNESNISCEFGGPEKDGEEKVDPFSAFMEEVNKPDAASGGAMLEIPFEFDTSFWDMLDNLGTSHDLQAADIDQLLEVDAGQKSHLGDQGIEWETESEKWLRYLENELELVEPAIEEDGSEHPKGASQLLN